MYVDYLEHKQMQIIFGQISATCSDKAGTRSFLAAPNLRSHSTGRLHQGAIF